MEENYSLANWQRDQSRRERLVTQLQQQSSPFVLQSESVPRTPSPAPQHAKDELDDDGHRLTTYKSSSYTESELESHADRDSVPSLASDEPTISDSASVPASIAGERDVLRFGLHEGSNERVTPFAQPDDRRAEYRHQNHDRPGHDNKDFLPDGDARPGFQYECVFHALPCYFVTRDFAAWKDHSTAHLHNVPPPRKVACPFCSWSPPPSLSAWDLRFEHVEKHHRLEGKRLAAGCGLDFSLYRHLAKFDGRRPHDLSRIVGNPKPGPPRPYVPMPQPGWALTDSVIKTVPPVPESQAYLPR